MEGIWALRRESNYVNLIKGYSGYDRGYWDYLGAGKDMGTGEDVKHVNPRKRGTLDTTEAIGITSVLEGILGTG